MSESEFDAPAAERDVTAADLGVGDTGPEVVVAEVTRRDFVKYAGASGDFNPIHYDDDLSAMAGYDDVFAQGMLTAGVAAQAVSHWFGLRAVDSYGVRFEAQVWPGDTVTAVAEITEVDRDGDTATVEADIEATTQDERIVLTGSATATIPAE